MQIRAPLEVRSLRPHLFFPKLPAERLLPRRLILIPRQLDAAVLQSPRLEIRRSVISRNARGLVPNRTSVETHLVRNEPQVELVGGLLKLEAVAGGVQDVCGGSRTACDDGVVVPAFMKWFSGAESAGKGNDGVVVPEMLRLLDEALSECARKKRRSSWLETLRVGKVVARGGGILGQQQKGAFAVPTSEASYTPSKQT
jgi:hypothetical protein